MTKNQIEKLKAQVQKLSADNRKWMRLAGIDRLPTLPNKLMLFQIILPNELANSSSQSFSLSCVLIYPTNSAISTRDPADSSATNSSCK